MSIPHKRLVIVSNRLPIILQKDQSGGWTAKSGSGGLVTALAPVLRNRGGLWVGWPGSEADEDIHTTLQSSAKTTGFNFQPVILDSYEIDKYYHGFSNEVIWPLFHDLQSRCNFDPEYWSIYQQVNRKFAQVIIENTIPDNYIWVHDYHLMTVARELARKKSGHKVGFFLHIPFPPPDIFIKLPWRSELLCALLDYDLIGLQTVRDRRNFFQCIRQLMPDVRIEGKGQVVTLQAPSRTIKVGSFPISIDYRQFAEAATTKEVSDCAWYIHENLGDRQIILGLDRLDYTKGILERLRAFERALEKYPDMHNRVTLLQVVVPSRMNIPEYQMLRTEIEQVVANINGLYTKYGWVPVHYIFRALDRYELLGYYRAAEIALVTPLKDGMNLVAKEYCACSLDENGVLILSEFAGASSQLHKNAIMVNPYHADSVADAIFDAFCMSVEERSSRMRRLRQSIRRYDIFWWVESFIEAAFTDKLNAFPVLDEYDYLPASQSS